MSHNRAEFIGNIGSDARIAQVGDQSVANFSIAVNEKRKGEETTTWVRCALWGKLVDAIGSYLVKGKQVMVAGPIRIEEYTLKESGEVRRELSVRVSDIVLLGGGEKRQSAGNPFE